MKRYFINDIKTFIMLILVTVSLVFFLFVCLKSADNKISVISCACVFGGSILLALFCLALCTEIIIIYDDKIVSKKVWKQKKILYTDIMCIEEADDRGTYAGGVETGWKIKNSSEQYIFVVEFFSRKKYIDFIKQKVNKTL